MTGLGGPCGPLLAVVSHGTASERGLCDDSLARRLSKARSSRWEA